MPVKRVIEEEFPDQLHPSHVTRISMDASTYDEICVNCGATDQVPGGWGNLRFPCKGKEKGASDGHPKG